MARQDINTEFNTFVGGILTEANPINYPKGFTQDQDNFLLERKGTNRRRLGLDYETRTVATTQTAIPSSNKFQGFYVWRDANSSGQDILVVWWDGLLTMYRLTNDLVVSPSTFNESISEEEIFSSTGKNVTAVREYKGNLVVASFDKSFSFTSSVGSVGTATAAGLDVFTYDLSTETVSTPGANIPIQVRDFVTLDDSLALNERPATLSRDHAYNLLNSGWSDTNITAFDTAIGDFPSNSDNMNTGLDGDTGVFTASWVDLANNGLANTPNGRNIVNIFAPDFSREKFHEDETGVGQTYAKPASTGIIKDIAEFKGRLCFLCNSNFNDVSPTFLAINSVGTDIDTYGDCFQSNDPTARDLSVLLDTDGVVLSLPDIGEPIKMIETSNSLVIFGTKGIFELISRDNIFRPAELTIRQITKDPVSHTLEEVTVTARTANYALGNSPVLVENDIFYFSDDGIIRLKYDANSFQYFPQNLSQDKIQSLFLSIKRGNRNLVQSIYVPEDRTVRFLYRSDSITGPGKDAELIYDLVLESWYKNKIDITTGSVLMYAQFLSRSLNGETGGTAYPVDPQLVTMAVGDATSQISCLRFCYFKDTTFTDFKTSIQGGTDAAAFMETGFINAGDTQRRKQANYIIPSFIRTEDGFTDDGGGNLTPTNESSCNIQARWDYADTDSGNLFGTTFEAYRFNRLFIPSGPSDPFDYGQSVITTKNKLLGRGRALSLRFSTTALKDCRILGWGLGFETETKV